MNFKALHQSRQNPGSSKVSPGFSGQPQHPRRASHWRCCTAGAGPGATHVKWEDEGDRKWCGFFSSEMGGPLPSLPKQKVLQLIRGLCFFSSKVTLGFLKNQLSSQSTWAKLNHVTLVYCHTNSIRLRHSFKIKHNTEVESVEQPAVGSLVFRRRLRWVVWTLFYFTLLQGGALVIINGVITPIGAGFFSQQLPSSNAGGYNLLRAHLLMVKRNLAKHLLRFHLNPSAKSYSPCFSLITTICLTLWCGK